MPLIATTTKLLLKLISVVSLAKVLKWFLGSDNVDEPQEKMLWLHFIARLAAIVFFIWGAVWAVQASGLPEHPLVIAALDAAAPFFAIIKWPLIAVTIWFINWFIWEIHLSGKDDHTLMDRWGWLLFSPFIGGLGTVILGFRNPIYGIELLIIVNGLMLWGAYRELPESAQLAITQFIHHLL